MVSSKVHISEPAEEDIVRLSEANRGRFASVVIFFLEEDELRDRMKDDLNYVEGGLPVWAIQTEHLFIAFIEPEDRVEVVHVAGRSSSGLCQIESLAENSVARLRI